MFSIRLLSAFVILAFVTIGCSSVSDSPTQSVSENTETIQAGADVATREFEWGTTDCAGNYALFNITEHAIVHRTTNSHGQEEVSITWIQKGKGLAEDGSKYQLNEVTHTTNSVQDSECTVSNEMVVDGIITTAGGGNNQRYRIVLNTWYDFCSESLGYSLISFDIECF